MTLADQILATDDIAAGALRAWLPSAQHRALTAEDLARVDAYGGSPRDLQASLVTILPLDRPVWYEAAVTAQRGTQMILGYGATPLGVDAIDVYFVAWAIGSPRLVVLGPMRANAHGVDGDIAGTEADRELRSAAGIVIRALLLGLGTS